MRALKVLVVVMGLMLVGGTAALIIAVIERANHHQPTQPTATPPGRGFDRAVVDLPAGAHLLGTQAVGDRLVLRVGLPGGGEELVLVDPRNGARLGTIELRAGQAGPGKP